MTVLAALVGYLLGSLPTAALLARSRGVDLRSQGSGNPGTANALRTSGPSLAITVLIVEAAKGYLAVLAGDWVADETGAVAAGLGAVAGNVYNLWYRFRGGKGLAISLGALVYLWPLVLAPVVVVIALGVLITRSSGIASLAAIATLVASSLLWQTLDWPTGGPTSTGLLPVVAVGIGLLISWKHWRDTPFSAPAPH